MMTARARLASETCVEWLGKGEGESEGSSILCCGNVIGRKLFVANLLCLAHLHCLKINV